MLTFSEVTCQQSNEDNNINCMNLYFYLRKKTISSKK